MWCLIPLAMAYIEFLEQTHIFVKSRVQFYPYTSSTIKPRPNRSDISFICSNFVGVPEQVLHSYPSPTGLQGFSYRGVGCLRIKLSPQQIILRARTRSAPANFTTSTRASRTFLVELCDHLGNELLFSLACPF